MCFICLNCQLDIDIEKSKIILNNLIAEKHNNLDSTVLAASESLDKLISACVNCKVKREKLANPSIYSPLSNHTSFYYYGTDHLITDLIHYIKNGIKNNELIYISMMDELNNQLLETLKELKIPTSNIHFNDITELILIHKCSSLKGLKEKLQLDENEALSNGFIGIRWVVQPYFMVTEPLKRDFSAWKKDLDEALNHRKTYFLCVYDFNDYLNENYD